MNAIELREQQHREVEDLFKQLTDAESGERQELWNELADRLAVHTKIEEEIFYPESKRAGVEDLLRESVEEHLSVKRLLADMLDMDLTDGPMEAQFEARCHELKEQVEHHVHMEETELFPKAQRFFGSRRLDELGDRLPDLAQQIEEQGEPRLEIPAETEALAPI